MSSTVPETKALAEAEVTPTGRPVLCSCGESAQMIFMGHALCPKHGQEFLRAAHAALWQAAPEVYHETFVGLARAFGYHVLREREVVARDG